MNLPSEQIIYTVSRPTEHPQKSPASTVVDSQRGTVNYWLGPTFSIPVQLITHNKWFVITSKQAPELKVARFLGFGFALRMLTEYCLAVLENYHGPRITTLLRELPLHEAFSNREAMESIIEAYNDDPDSSLREWLKALDPTECPLCKSDRTGEADWELYEACSIHK